jgi:hypothetical protein
MYIVPSKNTITTANFTNNADVIANPVLELTGQTGQTQIAVSGHILALKH